MSTWQPIETAPKDGTSVLLLIGEEAIQGHWVTYKNIPSEWKVISLSSHGCGCCSSDDPAPTHWMPLPVLPVLGSANPVTDAERASERAGAQAPK